MMIGIGVRARRLVVTCVAVLGAMATWFAGAAIASRTANLNLKISTHQTGPSSLGGSFSGTPWGRGTLTGSVDIPHETFVFHFKGGSATLYFTGTLKGSEIEGTGRWTHGTGKYAHIRGTARLTQGLTTGNGTVTGKFAY